MDRLKSVTKAVAPLASILLLLAGILQLRAESWTMGTVCIMVALPVFMISMRFLEKTPFTKDEIDTLLPWITPAVLWAIVAALLLVSVVYVADHFVSEQTNRFAAIAWVSRVILGFFVAWRNYPWRRTVPTFFEKVRANRREFIVLVLVLALAFTLRTIDLGNHPYPWSGDEASIGTEAMRILHGEITNFFETGWSSQPNWSFVPTAISELIFGNNIQAVRMPSVLAGTLAVFFVYLAGRELFHPAIALMAAVFLATLPYNLHFSRIGVHNIMDSFMSALVFWLIARAMKTDDPRYYYSAGAIGGPMPAPAWH